MPGKRPFTVIVEGNIGAGKTTFLSRFQRDARIQIEAEPVEKWRNVQNFNLLDLLYQDPKKWSFTFQSYVQLTMLQLHTKPSARPIKMMERSMYSARYCFVEHMSRTGNMRPEQVAVLDEWFQWVALQNMAPVDLIIYLRTTPEVAYNRLMKRGRLEERNISLDALNSLHELHETWLCKKSTEIPVTCPVIILDGDRSLTEMDYEFQRVNEKIPQYAAMTN